MSNPRSLLPNNAAPATDFNPLTAQLKADIINYAGSHSHGATANHNQAEVNQVAQEAIVSLEALKNVANSVQIAEEEENSLKNGLVGWSSFFNVTQEDHTIEFASAANQDDKHNVTIKKK